MHIALLLSVFVVASCGLAYELIAGALSSYLIGDSVTQFSTVIGTYLFAMGVGSYLSRFVLNNVAARFIQIELLVGLLGGYSAVALFWVYAFLTAPFKLVLYLLVLLLGTLVGSMLTGLVPTHELAVIFTVIVYVASFQMIMNFRPKASRGLPGRVGMAAVGTGIGGVSSLVAAGGGFLSIPFMVLCNVSIHQAVGTSAALGFPIAVAGTIGYIISGSGTVGLPGPSLGFVYLPAFFCVSAMTVLIAPYGAAFAHKLPVAKLKRAFGVFLGLLATKMLISLL